MLKRFIRLTKSLAFFTAALNMLFMITIEGCSGKIPEQPFVIPFDSQYITTDKKLSVMPSLHYKGSTTRYLLSITQKTYSFSNSNGTAEIEILLNRNSEAQIPEIGNRNAVSNGNCLSGADEVKCFTAHVDCHLVRTSYIKTGKRSIVVIKVRDSAREPQELCEQWNLKNLTPNQLAGVNEFNQISDSFFRYDKDIQQQTDSIEQTNSTHKKSPSNHN